jgi:predicted RNA-binding protein with PUA domain
MADQKITQYSDQKKSFLAVEIKLPQTEENDEIINQAEITTLDYDKRYGNYRLRINERELGQKLETIKKLICDAKEKFG